MNKQKERYRFSFDRNLNAFAIDTLYLGPLQSEICHIANKSCAVRNKDELISNENA